MMLGNTLLQFQLPSDSAPKHTPTHTLARLDWCAPAACSSALEVGVGFENLDNHSSAVELITTNTPVDYGRSGNSAWSRSDNYAFVAVHIPETPTQALEGVAYDAYNEWLTVVRQLGFAEPLRLWNFLPQINQGLGDNERYRRFCVGRELAFKRNSWCNTALPAATAIGNNGKGVLVFGLAAKRRFVQLENPRQVSAYDYPRQYGPASPSFARAGWLSGETNQAGLLLVSGTASVVGHESVHIGEIDKQLAESLRNIDQLTELCQQQHGAVEQPEILRVYLRDKSCLPQVAARIKEHWGNIPTQYLRGDICRADLLVEIEAVFKQQA